MDMYQDELVMDRRNGNQVLIIFNSTRSGNVGQMSDRQTLRNQKGVFSSILEKFLRYLFDISCNLKLL